MRLDWVNILATVIFVSIVVTLILAILVLICIGARLMVRMLRAGTVIDNRNFIDLSCSQRFRRH